MPDHLQEWKAKAEARKPERLAVAAALRNCAQAEGARSRKILIREAQRIEGCGQFGYVRTKDGEPERISASRCKSRVCPSCWHTASSSREYEVREMCASAAARGGAVWLLTFTMRPLRRVRWRPGGAHAVMQTAWRAWRKRTRRWGWVRGGLRRFEATAYHPKTGEMRMHEHFHAVVEIDATAPADAAARLSAAWCDAANDAASSQWGYLPREKGCGPWAQLRGQDAEQAQDALASGRYALKYTVKPYDAEFCGMVLLAMRGRRVLEYFGSWHGASLRTSDPARRKFVAETQKPRSDARRERERFSVLKNADVGSDLMRATQAEVCVWAGLPWGLGVNPALAYRTPTAQLRDKWSRSPALWRTVRRCARSGVVLARVAVAKLAEKHDGDASNRDDRGANHGDVALGDRASCENRRVGFSQGGIRECHEAPTARNASDTAFRRRRLQSSSHVCQASTHSRDVRNGPVTTSHDPPPEGRTAQKKRRENMRLPHANTPSGVDT